jgi:secretion/DNA translocation related CpaE-like protein
MSSSIDDPTGVPGRPAVITEDPALLEQLLRGCAATGVTPEVAGDTSTRRRAWAAAALVLVGQDQAPSLTGLGLGRRAGVVLLSQREKSAASWRLAVELGADGVLVLPDDERRLIDLLGEVAEGGGHGLVLGVVGACGGAGASTLAGALALTAAHAGQSAVLVDGDSLGGGVELLLGCEEAPGARWPELAATQGRVSARALRSALPALGPLPVLSWDASGPRPVPADVLRGLVGAAQRGAELVVADLPRHLDGAAAELLRTCAAVVLVVPSQVRAVAAARSLLSGLRSMCGDVRIVVRRTPHSDLTADSIAAVLGQPLAGVVPTRRSVARAIDDGLGPLGRGRLERSCRAILTTLDRRG